MSSPSFSITVLSLMNQILAAGVLLVFCAGTVILIWAEFSIVHAATSGEDRVSPEEKSNCPECGSRNPVNRQQCDYCGVPLPAET